MRKASGSARNILTSIILSQVEVSSLYSPEALIDIEAIAVADEAMERR